MLDSSTVGFVVFFNSCELCVKRKQGDMFSVIGDVAARTPLTEVLTAQEMRLKWCGLYIFLQTRFIKFESKIQSGM